MPEESRGKCQIWLCDKLLNVLPATHLAVRKAIASALLFSFSISEQLVCEEAMRNSRRRFLICHNAKCVTANTFSREKSNRIGIAFLTISISAGIALIFHSRINNMIQNIYNTISNNYHKCNIYYNCLNYRIISC